MHKPVLVEEVLALMPAETRLVIDCTIGGGGHAEAIVGKLGNEVELIGFDRDVAALEIARKQVEKHATRVRLVHDSYARMEKHIPDSAVGGVDFILMDLGLSSIQLEESGRGFSFQKSQESAKRIWRAKQRGQNCQTNS
jgi:16S rRNA (cytosine1402-N4)-methyltransferase